MKPLSVIEDRGQSVFATVDLNPALVQFIAPHPLKKDRCIVGTGAIVEGPEGRPTPLRILSPEKADKLREKWLEALS